MVKKLKRLNRKICHISTVHNSSDTRIFYRECKALNDAGYEVYFVVTDDKDDVREGVRIVSLPRNKGRFYRFFIKDFIAFVKAVKLDASVYHFHDPELILTGMVLKILGKKVIYDVHEDISKQMLNKKWIGTVALRKFFARIVNRVEIFISNLFFDAIVAATPSIAEKFEKRKVFVVRNFPILGVIDEVEPAEINEDKPVLIYAGGISKIRGVKDVIDAVGILKGKVVFYLVGKWESTSFEDECKMSEGWEYTRYLGFRSPQEVYSYMKSSDIGIAMLHSKSNYTESLPVKVFEYMGCGLPVVMSDFPYWKSFFKNCGVFVPSGEPESIANQIEKLLSDKGLYFELACKGREMIEKEYNWETEKKVLLKVYEDLSR